jgi:hypothetical protein
VAAPGARRLTLTGIMAVPDTFGRVRVLLVDRLLTTQRADFSWKTLLDEIPGSAMFGTPYRLHAVDTEGTRGEFWAVPPAHRRKHWLELAATLRGREVQLEVTVRNYTIAATLERTASHGASLDVSMIELAGASGTPGTASALPNVRGEIAK